MMTGHYGKEFDQVVRMLRRRCPVQRPISVRCLPDVRCLHSQQPVNGLCIAYLDEQDQIERFRIEVQSGLALDTAIDTLLHEWAHATDKEQNGIPQEFHRNSWGVCYAKAWRCYVEFVTP